MIRANAIKFMGKNPSPRIEIGHRGEDGFHRFWVEGNGIGIEPQYHGMIFELFQSSKEMKNEEGDGDEVDHREEDYRAASWSDLGEDGHG
ncbi:MAG: hypothetical protein JSW70_08275 [Syntrophobacterales bacterium]|nr:MAG: hypothetical protein JSW70_08275 [Syntrophobacterales bacterium]